MKKAKSLDITTGLISNNETMKITEQNRTDPDPHRFADPTALLAYSATVEIPTYATDEDALRERIYNMLQEELGTMVADHCVIDVCPMMGAVSR